jgi:hypothetical protein
MARLVFIGMGKARHYQSAKVPIWWAGEARDVPEDQAADLIGAFPGCFVRQDEGPMSSPQRSVVDVAAHRRGRR